MPKVEPPFFPSKWDFKPGYEPNGWECTAKSKQRGYRCKRKVTPGTDKCHNHGGKRPIKHGLRSKYGPPLSLRFRIEQLVNDPRIVDLKQYAARLFAILEDVESRVNLDHGFTDDDRERILPLLKQGVETAERFQRLATDKRFVDIIEARGFIARSLETILRFVPADRREEALTAVHALIGEAEDAEPGPAPGLH